IFFTYREMSRSSLRRPAWGVDRDKRESSRQGMEHATKKPAAGRTAATPAEKPKRKRDPVKSRQTILRTASTEFCQHGFSGARVERIATKSKSNMRMIYHYFGDKEGLYLAVLEDAYARMRNQENKLDLTGSDHIKGIRRLDGFTLHRQSVVER